MRNQPIEKFLLYEWFDSAKELMQKSLLPLKDFLGRIHNNKAFNETHSDSKYPMTTECNTAETYRKHKLYDNPPTGQETYAYSRQIRNAHNLQSFRESFCWYNNENVVPTLEPMMKMIQFYHDGVIDM